MIGRNRGSDVHVYRVLECDRQQITAELNVTTAQMNMSGCIFNSAFDH